MEINRDKAEVLQPILRRELRRIEELLAEIDQVLAEDGATARMTTIAEDGRLIEHVDVAQIRHLPVEDAIRLIARHNHNQFRPGQDKHALIAAGFIEDSKYGGNKLNRILSEMSDMEHQRRNLWELKERKVLFGDSFDPTVAEREEYEERLLGNWEHRASRPIIYSK